MSMAVSQAHIIAGNLDGNLKIDISAKIVKLIEKFCENDQYL